MKLSSNTIGWLNVTPLLAVLIPFFIVPILVVSVASIMQTDGYGGMFMDPTLANYVDVARSSLTYRLYFETMKLSFTWPGQTTKCRRVIVFQVMGNNTRWQKCINLFLFRQVNHHLRMRCHKTIHCHDHGQHHPAVLCDPEGKQDRIQ